ncbi:hypothetical protein [Natronorubrum sp. DTA7]|uniref:hypothetical protein n=1 Tax=Natronorubrum sp. DTA7 TaxID=3447016 RepID=UPI003F839275
MDEDSSEALPVDDRVEPEPRSVRMTTAVAPSLRTDFHLQGLAIADVLLFVAASVHQSTEYTHVATAIVLALAVLLSQLLTFSGYDRR